MQSLRLSDISASVLQAIAGSCRLLQALAGCCRLLQAVAGCCRLLQAYRMLQAPDPVPEVVEASGV